jgi:hypothetical protein
MLVQTGAMRDASSADCPYDTAHPKHAAEVQRLVKILNQMYTVYGSSPLRPSAPDI